MTSPLPQCTVTLFSALGVVTSILTLILGVINIWFCIFDEERMKLNLAGRCFNPKRAPGRTVYANICLYAIEHAPVFFLCLLNKCLELHQFPTLWKEAILVFLRKPGKTDYTTPRSCRPIIGLLSALGEILEKMLVTMLKYHLVPR